MVFAFHLCAQADQGVDIDLGQPVTRTMAHLHEARSADEELIIKAKECLQRATTIDVEKCVEIVKGLESRKAYEIRCKANYIRANIPTKIFNSALGFIGYKTVKDPLLGMMGVLVYSTRTRAEQTYENCRKSWSNIFAIWGGLARIGTIIASWGDSLLLEVENGHLISQSEMETALANIMMDASIESLEEIGEAVILAYENYCKNNQDNLWQSICKNLKEAFNEGNDGGDLPSVGRHYLDILDGSTR